MARTISRLRLNLSLQETLPQSIRSCSPTLSHELGDFATAKTQLSEALAINHAMGARGIAAHTLQAFAALSVELAGPTGGAPLWGATERVSEEIGAVLSKLERVRFERQVAAARSALNDDAMFDAAWNEGRSWTWDEAVRHALSI
jgi:hypothetical protein